MTTMGLVRLISRRWYVYVALLIMAVVTIQWISALPRVFVAESAMTFAAPAPIPGDTDYTDFGPSLIAFSLAVDRRYNEEFPSERLSSPSATLFGNGLRDGVSVEMDAVGGQWFPGYNKPTIAVRVAANSEESALSKLHLALEQLEGVSTAMQTEADTPASRSISATYDAQDFLLSSYGQTKTGRAKGAVVTIAIALVVATGASRGLDLLMRKP